MKSRFLLAALAFVGVFAATGIAAAQSIAYSVPGLTNVRAGPGLEYPVVAQIGGGSLVNIYGCLPESTWCDSGVGEMRGWISTSRLEFQYAGNLVPLPTYYTYFRAPIVRFDFGYWDRHYRARPFYAYRSHYYRDWMSRPRDHDRARARDNQRSRQQGGSNSDNSRRRQGGGGRCFSQTGICR